MKKRPPYNQNSMIRGAIRRTFSRSPVVREVLMAGRREVPKYNKDGSLAKKPAVQYQCEVCSTWVSSTKVSVDHIDPVISVDDGFVDWNQFVDRLFCDKTNLQRICDDCHDKKTASERFERMYKKELSELNDIGSSTSILKKLTPKRLLKYPYPKDFIDRVRQMRKRIGLKV